MKERDSTPYEILKDDLKSESLLWLLSVPGTTSHIVFERERFLEIKKLFCEGKALIPDSKSKESYISLHIALSQGVSTIFNSDFSYLYPTTYQSTQGFILKPEFFLEKIGSVSEEAIINMSKKIQIVIIYLQSPRAHFRF